MKRILSFFTALSILIISLNISVSAEETVITSTAETGRYTWNFSGTGEASNIYNIADEYAALRISLGSGDSISPDKGIYFSNPSCNEPTTSASDSGRYLLIKPEYSGKVYFKIQFTNATNSAKGRIWYNDFGTDKTMNEVDVSTLQKGVGTQVGSDFTGTSAQTLSFDVTAGHIYSLHTYNRTSYISELYYTSDDIVGKTATPSINTPITSSDTSITGTCAENAQVSVKINDGAAQNAAVSGTEWTLTNLTLNANDTISVTAKAGEYKESNAATAIVTADDSVCTLTVNSTEHGSVTSDMPAGRVTKGSVVTLTVTPDSDYRLKTLTVGGDNVTVKEDNTYSFTINDDTTVSAEFEAIPYHSISLVQGANGTVSVTGGASDTGGSVRAAEGERVTLSISPDKGYRIKSLTYKKGEEPPVEFKYGAFFYMPDGDVTVTAEFKKEDTVSYVDTTFDTYDRLTLMVDNKPFFFNGIQVRPDNALDQLKFSYDQIREMYMQAGEDGYTVVNSQIRWRDVQPDKAFDAAETRTDGNITYITFNNLPAIEENAEYAAVKLRIYAQAAKDTKYTVYGVENNVMDEASTVISPDWDMVSATKGYHSVNVADFVNKHKNDGAVTFAVVPEGETAITMDSAIAPQLKLSRDDVYDWTHLDKILDYSHEAGVKLEILWFATDTCQQSHEVRVPYYVHANYQKCLKQDGTPAKNLGADNNFIMCKNDLDLRAKEKEVLETVFDHIADYDAEHGYGSLVVGCQVANETAVGRLHSGTDEDKYFGHCYCDTCMEKLSHSKSEAAYREDTLWEYLNNLSSAVKESKCSVWTRENNYMTTDTNVLAYNESKRSTTGTDLDFIGLDPYSVTGGADHDYIYSFGHESCTYKNHTYNYSQGKNLPMAMEFGGNNKDLDESIFTAIAGGSNLNVYELLSGKEDFGTYVATRDSSGNATGFQARTSYTYQNGSSFNWSDTTFIGRVRSMNAMLNKVKYDLATKKADGAGGEKLVFFNPKFTSAGTSFTNKVRTVDVTYNTECNSGGIAIEKSDREVVLLSTGAAEFVLDGLGGNTIKSVEKGYFNDDTGSWVKEDDKAYTSESGKVTISMEAYDCVKLTTAGDLPAKPVTTPLSGVIDETTYTFKIGTPDEVSGMGTYNYSDDYIQTRLAIASGDSVTSTGGLIWSAASCTETDSAYDNNRYLLIKPKYSGNVTVKFSISKPSNASANVRGCLYLNDYGTDGGFNSADLSKLKKDAGTKIGGDIRDSDETEQTFEVEAGHLYSLHTYNFGAVVTDISIEMTGVPEKPDLDTMPVTLTNLNISSEGKPSASAVYNGEGAMPAVKLIAAQYSGGVLEDVDIIEVTDEGEIDFGACVVDIRRDLKFFVWDNTLETMTPMSRVYTNADIKQ